MFCYFTIRYYYTVCLDKIQVFVQTPSLEREGWDGLKVLNIGEFKEDIIL